MCCEYVCVRPFSALTLLVGPSACKKDLAAIAKSDVVDLRKLLIRVSKELSTVNIMYTLFGFKEYDFFYTRSVVCPSATGILLCSCACFLPGNVCNGSVLLYILCNICLLL